MKGFNALCYLLAVCMIATVAATPLLHKAQADAPSVGTYLGQAGYSKMYQIKAEGITCVLAERNSYSPSISCVVR